MSVGGLQEARLCAAFLLIALPIVTHTPISAEPSPIINQHHARQAKVNFLGRCDTPRDPTSINASRRSPDAFKRLLATVRLDYVLR